VVKEERSMTVTFPPELEWRVAQMARAEGISSQAYVERVIRAAMWRAS
jgi:predicted HicB family RNase H-like nuclease